eukprot:s749_g5.t1
MPNFVCLTCGAELFDRPENSDTFGCEICGSFLTESQTQQQDYLDSAEFRDANAQSSGGDFKSRRRFQRGEFMQNPNSLEPWEERYLNWELYLKSNYGLKHQQDIFAEMLVAAANCFNCNQKMVLDHGKQLWFRFLESIQAEKDEQPGQALHNEGESMALQFSQLNGLAQHVTDRIMGDYRQGPFEQFFRRRDKCEWVKLALQKHEQLLQDRLKKIQNATGHHRSKLAPGHFNSLPYVQRAEIIRQDVRKRAQARLRLDKQPFVLQDLDGQMVPLDMLEEKEKQEFYKRFMNQHAVVADVEEFSLSGDSSDEEPERTDSPGPSVPAAPEKKRAKAKAKAKAEEQVLLASSDSNEEVKPAKSVASAPLKNQAAPETLEEDPGANYHDAEDVTERRRLFLTLVWMALSSSCQAVLLGDVILAAFQGPLRPWIEKYEHLLFAKLSMQPPPLNQDTLYEQLKARCGRLIRCRYRFVSQHPEMFLHRFAGLLEDEQSVMELARMCCRSRLMAGYWQRMIASIEQFKGLSAKVKGISDKYMEGTAWCPASKAFFCVLAGLRLHKMRADEEAKYQDMLDKKGWQEDGEDEGGRIWTNEGLKSIPALYEKKTVKRPRRKRQDTERIELRTTTNPKNRQRSRSRGAGRDDDKDRKGKKGQDEDPEKEEKGEKGKKGAEDEQTRHVKYMIRLARLALEMTETLMGKKCRQTAVHFTLHSDLLATEIYRGVIAKRPQLLLGPLVAALEAAN